MVLTKQNTFFPLFDSSYIITSKRATYLVRAAILRCMLLHRPNIYRRGTRVLSLGITTNAFGRDLSAIFSRNPIPITDSRTRIYAQLSKRVARTFEIYRYWLPPILEAPCNRSCRARVSSGRSRSRGRLFLFRVSAENTHRIDRVQVVSVQ